MNRTMDKKYYFAIGALLAIVIVFSVSSTWTPYDNVPPAIKQMQNPITKTPTKSPEHRDTIVSLMVMARDVKCPLSPRSKSENSLTMDEQKRADTCVSNHQRDFQKGHSAFWSGNEQYVRHKFHKYLGADSIVVDVGGNVGEDAEALMKLYNPRRYDILEPLGHLYKRLVKKFKSKFNVFVYNFGLGFKDEEFMVAVEGHDGDATSIFSKKSGKGKTPLKVFNTTDFFVKLGVGCFDLDLLTINCEGCEFAIVESIIRSNIIQHVKHLQFATHSKLKTIDRPVERYCEIQELLNRTHTLSYQYKFNWETWTIKK